MAKVILTSNEIKQLKTVKQKAVELEKPPRFVYYQMDTGKIDWCEICGIKFVYEREKQK